MARKPRTKRDILVEEPLVFPQQGMHRRVRPRGTCQFCEEDSPRGQNIATNHYGNLHDVHVSDHFRSTGYVPRGSRLGSRYYCGYCAYRINSPFGAITHLITSHVEELGPVRNWSTGAPYTPPAPPPSTPTTGSPDTSPLIAETRAARFIEEVSVANDQLRLRLVAEKGKIQALMDIVAQLEAELKEKKDPPKTTPLSALASRLFRHHAEEGGDAFYDKP